MEINRIESIREAERKSHTSIYTSAVLFEKGTWLSKPVKTVMDLLPLFSGKNKFRGLDLGCGIGRNCIPIAQYLKDTDCEIDCVDILDLAITQLRRYSEIYHISDKINGAVMPLEDFQIKPNHYDLILAVSSLEHVKSEVAFYNMLRTIEGGVCKGGIICFVISSDIIEIDKITQTRLIPQFEVNLSSEELKEAFEKIYSDWEVIKYTVKAQQYEIPRETAVCLSANVVTFAAQKPYG